MAGDVSHAENQSDFTNKSAGEMMGRIAFYVNEPESLASKRQLASDARRMMTTYVDQGIDKDRAWKMVSEQLGQCALALDSSDPKDPTTWDAGLKTVNENPVKARVGPITTLVSGVMKSLYPQNTK